MAQIIEIEDLSLPALQVYTSMTEPALRHHYEAEHGVFIAESPKVIRLALKAGYEPVSVLMDKAHLRDENEAMLSLMGDVPVYVGDSRLLQKITGFQLTRGTLSCFRRRELPTVEEVTRRARRICVIENVMNPANIGSIFRSAAALSMDAVLLTEGSSDPLYRRAARVSMGSVFQIPWTYLPGKWPMDGMSMLHTLGFSTAALALNDRAVSIRDPHLHEPERLAIILGTEGDGLMKETIDSADFVVMIPMSHGVDSLNVASASAVAFYELG